MIVFAVWGSRCSSSGRRTSHTVDSSLGLKCPVRGLGNRARATRAQARVFVALLIDRIGELSSAIEAANRRAESAQQRRKPRIEAAAWALAEQLRLELVQIERQIDSLRMRFPGLGVG